MPRRISGLLALLFAALMSFSAFAQSALLQGGPWTPGHAPMYSVSGNAQPVLQDPGTALGGALGYGLKEFLQVNRGSGAGPYADVGLGPYSTNNCLYDGPTTGAYHYLCFDANAQGGALLAVGYGGGATPLPLSFIINGVTYDFPVDSLLTIATLPTCNAALQGVTKSVSNGTAFGTGAYGAAVSATGAVTRRVLCTNTAGPTSYAWAYD
jgi:hypothetical protein